MSEFADSLSDFHFLRPWVLALIPLAAALAWRVRRGLKTQAPQTAGLAPHLIEALSVSSTRRARITPIDLMALFVALSALAAAGPTWSRLPNPLVAQTAPLAVALKVSASMERRDVAPSRLQRAKQKVLDLLDVRAGARTALIAYAGGAHRVVPLTEDPDVIKPFLEGLSPEIMPRPGDNAAQALQIAAKTLAKEPTRGAILFVADSIDRADAPALKAHLESGGDAIIVLGVTKDRAALDDLASIRGLSVVAATPDRSDVFAVERRAVSAYRAALDADQRLIWNDRGWIFAWPAALLALLWFRRGWSMRWSGAILAAILGAALAAPGGEARAQGVMERFFTADQRAWFAYQDKDYRKAATLFEDPAWRGHALYRGGQFKKAAEVLSGLETAEAAFTAGMSHMKSRGYRAAIASFATALERDPTHRAAARNLQVAKAVLAYIETEREANDDGKDRVGADEVVFDNEDDRGAEARMEVGAAEEITSTEQWMRAVDTRTGDFLRSRFLQEEARRSK